MFLGTYYFPLNFFMMTDMGTCILSCTPSPYEPQTNVRYTPNAIGIQECTYSKNCVFSPQGRHLGWLYKLERGVIFLELTSFSWTFLLHHLKSKLLQKYAFSSFVHVQIQLCWAPNKCAEHTKYHGIWSIPSLRLLCPQRPQRLSQA